MGKLLKRIPNSSRIILNKRIDSLNNSDLGVHDYGHGIFEVYNFDNDSLHKVLYTDRGYIECDCIDYSKNCEPLGLPCKHILAVKRFLETEPEYLSNEFEEFIKNLLRKEVIK